MTAVRSTLPLLLLLLASSSAQGQEETPAPQPPQQHAWEVGDVVEVEVVWVTCYLRLDDPDQGKTTTRLRFLDRVEEVDDAGRPLKLIRHYLTATSESSRGGEAETSKEQEQGRQYEIARDEGWEEVMYFQFEVGDEPLGSDEREFVLLDVRTYGHGSGEFAELELGEDKRLVGAENLPRAFRPIAFKFLSGRYDRGTWRSEFTATGDGPWGRLELHAELDADRRGGDTFGRSRVIGVSCTLQEPSQEFPAKGLPYVVDCPDCEEGGIDCTTCPEDKSCPKCEDRGWLECPSCDGDGRR